MSNIQFSHTLTDEITISPGAIKQLIAITESKSDVAGVRIFVQGGGCGGMEYGMENFQCLVVVHQYDGLTIVF